MTIPAWEDSFLEPVLTLTLFTIGFLVYFAWADSAGIQSFFTKRFGEHKGPTYFLWASRYAGALSIGIIPALLMLVVLPINLSDVGISIPKANVSWWYVLAIILVLVPFNYRNSKRPEHLAFYPNVREKNWTKSMVVFNALSWVGYLFGYELMFRGVLLFSSLRFMDVWPAIVLNVVLYALVHVPKSMGETIGSIPLGLVMCLLALSTGSIWPAFVIHVVLALSNFFFSLRHHPEMHI